MLVPSRKKGFPFFSIDFSQYNFCLGARESSQRVPRMIYLACLMSVGVAFEDSWPQY